MDDAIEKIVAWSQEVKEYEAVSWERMPEIDLYMDQVITYMDKLLKLFERNELNKLLTPSMINNYVKDSLLPRPEQKKYSRDHLAGLMVICLLKQVLSIPDISALLKSLQTEGSMSDLYNKFCAAQKSALDEICGRVSDTAAQGENELYKLALELSIEANARRIAAERILNELGTPKPTK